MFGGWVGRDEGINERLKRVAESEATGKGWAVKAGKPRGSRLKPSKRMWPQCLPVRVGEGVYCLRANTSLRMCAPC